MDPKPANTRKPEGRGKANVVLALFVPWAENYLPAWEISSMTDEDGDRWLTCKTTGEIEKQTLLAGKVFQCEGCKGMYHLEKPLEELTASEAKAALEALGFETNGTKH